MHKLKTVYILTAIIMAAAWFGSCAVRPTLSSTSASSASPTSETPLSSEPSTPTTQIVSYVLIEWAFTDSIQKLIARSDIIAVGDVIEEGEAFLISEKDMYTSGGDANRYWEHVPLTVKVLDVYMGDLIVGTHFVILQHVAGFEEYQLIHAGERHLFFLSKPEKPVYYEALPRYYLGAPDAGWPMIVDGKLYVDPLSDIFNNGLPLDFAKEKLLEIIGQP